MVHKQYREVGEKEVLGGGGGGGREVGKGGGHDTRPPIFVGVPSKYID